MTDYSKLFNALQDMDVSDACDYCEHSDMCKDDDCIILQAAAAIDELQAEVADKNCLIQQQTYEIQRLMADVKRQQKKMIELAKKLPKRGEWLNVTDSYHWYGKCSVCGEEFVVDAYYAGAMNYCPNCGAKMEVRDGANRGF